MSVASAEVLEFRCVIEPELTQCFILVKAHGDCPIGVQGWHHKTFPSSMSCADILEAAFLKSAYLLWANEAP